MNKPMTAADDNRELFARLRRMWTARDPMPPGLVDDILVRLGTEDLSSDLALLTLVAESDGLVGVRGASDNHTFEFSDGDTTLLLRVSGAGAGTRRVDGWLAPASRATIHLDGASGEKTTEADADGRFAFADIPEGRVRIWFDRLGTDADRESGTRAFTTLEFEL
ncbi:MAG: hypothetical protein M3N46_04630 [Actinomycetota bacterium]|nr:hypothetical protein [Actinomycetota bacterium]